MTYEKTTKDAYVQAMEYLNIDGYLPACVVVHDGEDTGVYTTVGFMGPGWIPKDDMDCLASAIVAIKRARDEAERCGLHPVH